MTRIFRGSLEQFYVYVCVLYKLFLCLWYWVVSLRLGHLDPTSGLLVVNCVFRDLLRVRPPIGCQVILC